MITFLPDPRLLDSPRGRDWPGLAGSRAAGAAWSSPPRTADVVVVGAGPAGLAVASALWHHGIRDVVLLDRDGRPCGRFLDRIDLLRQRVLRSPYEHHPGVEGFRDCELLDFARLHWGLLTDVERREIRMAQAGQRSVVPVDVFDAYCRHIAESHHVTERLWRTTVRAVRPEGDVVTVESGAGVTTARFVVLCLGESRRPAPGSWFGGGPLPSRVSYWDEPVPAGTDRVADRVTVVGAGLTAAHLVSNALADGRRVDWVIRETAERYQCADVNSAFFRPEGRSRFDGVAWSDRIAMLRTHRRASIMFEFRPKLRAAEADGRLVVHRGRPVDSIDSIGAMAPGRDGRDGVVVRLADGTAVPADRVVLALGTLPSTGVPLLPESVVAARDGWPALDERTFTYRNAPRVAVVGAAAGMALGPAARNIDGHRVATARVAAAIAAGLRRGEPLRSREETVARV